jgi:hypothetical protein
MQPRFFHLTSFCCQLELQVLAGVGDRFFSIDACSYVCSSATMPKEDIGNIPREEIELAIARLEAFAIHLQQVRKWFENNPDKTLWVWRYKSLDRGITALETLPAEFMRAIHAHSRGVPQGPNSSKARTAKQKPKPVEDVAKIVDSHRKKTKKKP